MPESKLDCCIVRDLLPSYLEELTEEETSSLVKEHIEHCEDCRRLENDMRVHVPVEKPPRRALKFLKRVKRTRLMAAILSAIVMLFCMWWLYDHEFHYANTEAGRLEAICDYIPQPEGSTIPHSVKVGTSMRVVAWQTIDRNLYIFFAADNGENVHGVMELERGLNGKYRALEASYSPSQYTAGIYGNSVTTSGTERRLFILSGDNCRDIYSAEVHYIVHGNMEEPFSATKTYTLTEANFMWIMDEAELIQEFGLDLENEQLVRPSVKEVRLFDKNGEDITDEYRDETVADSGGIGIGTTELFAPYVYMGIVAALAFVFIRCFLRND